MRCQHKKFVPFNSINFATMTSFIKCLINYFRFYCFLFILRLFLDIIIFLFLLHFTFYAIVQFTHDVTETFQIIIMKIIVPYYFVFFAMHQCICSSHFHLFYTSFSNHVPVDYCLFFFLSFSNVIISCSVRSRWLITINNSVQNKNKRKKCLE